MLPDIISSSQGAFVTGRGILTNIIICQGLVRSYKKSSTRASRCVMKLDLRKAYDIVNWNFVQQLLEGVGFPQKFC